MVGHSDLQSYGVHYVCNSVQCMPAARGVAFKLGVGVGPLPVNRAELGCCSSQIWRREALGRCPMEMAFGSIHF